MPCIARRHTPTTSCSNRGADYILTVKNYQRGLPTLEPSLEKRSRPGTATIYRGHRRVEQRTHKVVSVSDGIPFPHGMQVIPIVRKSRKIKGMKSRTEVVYAVTSELAAHTTAAGLATWIRGHRCVENRLRWVRDVTSGEDRSPVRTANGLRIMVSLGSLAISILRWTAPPTSPKPSDATHGTHSDPLHHYLPAETGLCPDPGGTGTGLDSLDHAVLAQRHRGPLA
jgi:predicted transposase YbfD/YdcC